MPSDLPFRFHDLPASSFPLGMAVYDAAGKVLWSEVVSEPGVLQVPAFGDRGQLARVICADGTVVDVDRAGNVREGRVRRWPGEDN